MLHPQETAGPGLEGRRAAPGARFDDIDRVKAVAIILVVAGHISDSQSPSWWRTLRFDIYNFHMPLFMYLSGYVYFRAVNSPKNSRFWPFCTSRANRLLVPFFVFGIGIINIKFFARNYADLRRSGFSYIDGYKFLLINTSQNPAYDLWYLFVLFVFSVTSYHAMRKSTHWISVLFSMSLIAYGVFAYYEPRGGMTDEIYLDHLCWFYIFFVIGAIACRWRERLYTIQKKIWPVAMVLFFLSQFAINHPDFAFVSGWRFLIVGCLSIAFLHGMFLGPCPYFGSLFHELSANTLMIYLFNSMIIAGLQQTVFKAHPLSIQPYVIQVVILTAAATVLPILLRFVLSRISFLGRVNSYLT